MVCPTSTAADVCKERCVGYTWTPTVARAAVLPVSNDTASIATETRPNTVTDVRAVVTYRRLPGPTCLRGRTR